MMKIVHEFVPKARNMHILFYEQAVRRSGTKGKKAFLMMGVKWLLNSKNMAKVFLMMGVKWP